MNEKDAVSRKKFVLAAGAIASAAGLAAHPEGAEAAHGMEPPVVAVTKPPAKTPLAPPLGNEPEAYTYLTMPEAAFVEAAVDRLIPTDDLGPGAKPAGVAFYIDQQLEAQYGFAAKMYCQGPWGQALPTQGYQLPLNPREVYRLGIAATNGHCTRTFGKTFDKLDGAHQDQVLSALEKGQLDFTEVPSLTFFGMLYENTVEGFFADPLYGGNRDKAGWKMIGFPGVAAAYDGYIEKHNVLYRVAPVSIADVEHSTGLADDDAHMPLHHVAMARKRGGK
jgi:gluconate 2-dehydrogenase gamma chain